MIRRFVLLAVILLARAVYAAEGPPPRGVESFEAAWEILRDTHFDTNFNGLDWNAVRAELLPKAQNARTQDDVRAVIQTMIDKLGH